MIKGGQLKQQNIHIGSFAAKKAGHKANKKNNQSIIKLAEIIPSFPHSLKITDEHTEINSLLKKFVSEIRNFTACNAVGIRILDEAGNIPYQAYEGFLLKFYELESPLSIKSDQCMCINVIKGTTDPKLSFYTENGSFYLNATTRFLAAVPEEEKGQTRNVCNQFGYESVALVPIRAGNRILGLIHIADEREDKVPLETVNVIENVAMQLGAVIQQLLTEEELKIKDYAINSSINAIAIADIEGNLTYINPSFLRLWGYNKKEVIGKSIKDFWQAEEKAAKVMEALYDKESWTGELVALRKGNSTFHAQLSANMVKDESGKPICIMASFVDITGLKKTEQILEESRKKYKELAESISDVFFGMDKDLKYTYWNKASEELTKIPVKDAIGKSIYDIFPDNEETRRAIKIYKEVIKKQQPKSFVNEYHLGGRKYFFEISAYPSKYGLSVFVKDITESKKAEEEMRLHEQIMTNMSEGVYLVRADDGIIRYTNPKFEEMFGYAPGEMLGKHVSIVNAPTGKSPEETAREFIEIMNKKDIWQGEVKNIKKDGTPFWSYASISKFEHPEHGKILVTAHRDITEKKEAEEKIKKLNFDLKERIKEFKGLCSLGKLTDDISSKEELFSRFLKKIIPSSMRFPEKTIAKIEFDSRVYSNLKNVQIIKKNSLHSCIIVKGKKRGTLSVGYTEALPFILKFEQRLIDSYAERLGRIIERLEAHSETAAAKDQLNNIINSASELIVSVNKDGLITAWNEAIASLTGIPQKEMLSKNIHDNNLSPKITPLIGLLKSTLKTNKTDFLEHGIKDSYSNPKVILSSTSVIKDKDNSVKGVVLIGRDISSQKKLCQQLLPGNSYLSYNESFEDIIDIFNTFSHKNYSLLCICREKLGWLKNRLANDTPVLLMSGQKYKDITTLTEPGNILKEIKMFLSRKKRSLILLNGLGYISSVYSFSELLTFLYKLHDLTRFSANIVIIHILKDCFEERELALLKQEFAMFPAPKKEDIRLDQKKIDILRFISNKESFNFNVQYGHISKKFNLSRMTTKNWLNELQMKDLVRTEKAGRVKYVYITSTGKELVSKY